MCFIGGYLPSRVFGFNNLLVLFCLFTLFLMFRYLYTSTVGYMIAQNLYFSSFNALCYVKHIKIISLFCFEAFCRRFSGNLSLFFCLILTCPFQRIRFLCLFSLWNINLPFFGEAFPVFSRRFIFFPVRSPRSPRRRPFFSRRHLPSARLSILAQPLS